MGEVVTRQSNEKTIIIGFDERLLFVRCEAFHRFTSSAFTYEYLEYGEMSAAEAPLECWIAELSVFH